MKIVKNPLKDVLSAMTHSYPPDYLNGLFSSDELHEAYYLEFQDWCASNVLPAWATGIGLIEAADKMVLEAVRNGNIEGKL